jgi:hypothetical protein
VERGGRGAVVLRCRARPQNNREKRRASTAFDQRIEGGMGGHRWGHVEEGGGGVRHGWRHTEEGGGLAGSGTGRDTRLAGAGGSHLALG